MTGVRESEFGIHLGGASGKRPSGTISTCENCLGFCEWGLNGAGRRTALGACANPRTASRPGTRSNANLMTAPHDTFQTFAILLRCGCKSLHDVGGEWTNHYGVILLPWFWCKLPKKPSTQPVSYWLGCLWPLSASPRHVLTIVLFGIAIWLHQIWVVNENGPSLIELSFFTWVDHTNVLQQLHQAQPQAYGALLLLLLLSFPSYLLVFSPSFLYFYLPCLSSFYLFPFSVLSNLAFCHVTNMSLPYFAQLSVYWILRHQRRQRRLSLPSESVISVRIYHEIGFHSVWQTH